MRRLIQVVLLLLLLVHLWGAPFEAVDHWDNAAQGGDDIVFNVLGVVAAAGLILVTAYLVRSALRLFSLRWTQSLAVLGKLFEACHNVAPPAPTESPPLPLRI